MSQSKSPLNLAKANFDSAYVGVTPIPYMRCMSSVGYEIPQNARQVFDKLIHHLQEIRGRPLRILDVGCSYGINASLLRYQVTLDDLYSHDSDLAHLCENDSLLIKADEKYFAGLQPRFKGHFMGVDASANAIMYATKNGLLDAGVAMDLENEPHPPRVALAVDLIISTGTIGYIGPGGLVNLLRLCSNVNGVWAACFALRLIDFEPYARVFADRGMSTEVYPKLFKQRDMADEREQVATKALADSVGTSVAGIEDTGALFAKLYLARTAEPGALSLNEMLDG
jgi:SAM-dependent methyltransferase